MTKKEWIDVLDSAYDKARKDYQVAKCKTPEEYMARLCMSIFGYLSSSIRESNER